MAVLFAPQQPFSQQAAERYGQSQMLMNQARLYAQGRSDVAHLQAAELGARVQGASAAADAAFRGAQLESQAVAQGRDIAAQYGLQAERFQAQSAMQNAEAQNRAQLAVLDQQLTEKTLSFREQQDLNQLQQQYKQVDDDPNLSASEKYQLKSLMGPRISRLMAQESLSKQKMQDEEVQLMKAKNALIQEQVADAQAYQAAKAGNSLTFVPDPTQLDSIRQELVDLGNNPNDPNFENKLKGIAKERGAGQEFYQTKQGLKETPESQGRREQRMKMEQLKYQEEAKGRAEREKAVGDFITSSVLEARKTGQTPDMKAIMSEADQLRQWYEQRSPEGLRAAAAKVDQEKIGAIAVARDELTTSERLGPIGQRYAAQLLDRAESLLKNNPPSSRSKDVQAELNRIEEEIKNLKYNANLQAPKPAVPSQQAAPAPASGQQAGGYRYGESLRSDVKRVAGRAAGQTLKGIVKGGEAVAEAGEYLGNKASDLFDYFVD